MTTIIFVKGGMRQTVGYNMPEKEALIEFKKEYGSPKILFINYN